MDDTMLSRFWSKIDKNGPVPAHVPHLGPCWIWTASLRNGYGTLYVRGRKEYAHRFSFEIHHGRPPSGLCVLHRCDNRRCCKPTHFFLGTKGDNNRDTAQKGRHGTISHPESIARGDRHGSRLHPESRARGDRSGSRLHPERLARGDRNGSRLHPEQLKRGEQCSQARLTAADIPRVFQLHRDGLGTSAIGRLLGVTHNTITFVLARKTWRHVAI
jgi:hypothetical protein